MMNFFKQVGKSAQDEARKMAIQAREQSKEFVRIPGFENKSSAKSESGPSMMQEVMTEGGKFVPPTEMEMQNIHAKTKSRLEQIEAELRQLRMRREKKSEEWVREQDRVMGTSPEEQSKKPEPVALPSKKPHGAQQPGKKKSSDNTMENSRQKKG